MPPFGHVQFRKAFIIKRWSLRSHLIDRTNPSIWTLNMIFVVFSIQHQFRALLIWESVMKPKRWRNVNYCEKRVTEYWKDFIWCDRDPVVFRTVFSHVWYGRLAYLINYMTPAIFFNESLYFHLYHLYILEWFSISSLLQPTPILLVWSVVHIGRWRVSAWIMSRG